MDRESFIYLDHASTTPPLPCALDAFNHALTDRFGNPSSAHAFGQRSRDTLEASREIVAKCIGAKPEEIVFTSGATEACNLAVSCLTTFCDRVARSDYEHHSVSEPVDAFAFPPVRTKSPIGYAQMLVCNETGNIFSMPERMYKEDLIFSDLTSAVGHISVNVKDLGINYGAFASHKIGGIPGVGILYVREHSPFVPTIEGGGQERGMRAGTESVALISAMAAALEWQCEHMKENAKHVQDLWIQMYSELCDRVPDVQLNSEGRVSPYILNVSFPGVEGSALVLLLSKMGVMVSEGAACTTGDNAPSHVLMAMYNDEARARSAIRISFSHDNTVEEVKAAAKKIAEAVKTLRGILA